MAKVKKCDDVELTESQQKRLNSIRYDAQIPIGLTDGNVVDATVSYTRNEYERRQSEKLDSSKEISGGNLYELWRYEPDLWYAYKGKAIKSYREMSKEDRVGFWNLIVEEAGKNYKSNWLRFGVVNFNKITWKDADKMNLVRGDHQILEMPKYDIDDMYSALSSTFAEAIGRSKANTVDEIRNRFDSFTPFEQQRHFLASNYDTVLYGGARGGGKTHCLIIDCALHVRRWSYGDNGEVVIERQSIDYPEYHALILRRTFADIYRNFKPMCDKVYPKLGGVWREKTQSYTFPSGATISLGYCDSDDDVQKYIGGNFHYLGIEELNQFPKEWIDLIAGSVRSTNPELIPFKRYTTNPGGVGHVWIKKYFVDSCPPVLGEKKKSQKHNIEYQELKPGEPMVDENGNVRWYIPALVFDNPALVDNDPNYVNTLKGLDPVTRKMWLLGSWDEMSGLFFSSWSHAFHVIDERDFVLDKENCRLYRCIDYGTSAPFACMFVKVDRLGRAVVFDEVYFRGLTASMQAKEIKNTMKRWDLTEDDIDITVVDPSMKSPTQDAGMMLKSVIEIYYDNGLKNITLGNNARVLGWSVFKEYLQIPDHPDAEGELPIPWLRFTTRCVNAIETIPTLVQSKNNVDDLDTKGLDHIADAIRYLLMFIKAPTFRAHDNKEPMWLKAMRENAKNTSDSSIDDVWAT